MFTRKNAAKWQPQSKEVAAAGATAIATGFEVIRMLRSRHLTAMEEEQAEHARKMFKHLFGAW